MLQLKTLANKREFTKTNGDKVIDLIGRAVSFLGVRVNSGKIYVVSEETAMRADLISNYFYQDSSYLDLLLKYNGYSNPFSLNVGDIIRVPSAEVLSKFGGLGTLGNIGNFSNSGNSGNLGGNVGVNGSGLGNNNDTGSGSNANGLGSGSNASSLGNGNNSSNLGSLSNLGNNNNRILRTRKKFVNTVLAPRSKKDQARLNYLLQRGNAVDSNLTKLNLLLQNGNLSNISLSALSGKISTILQGGNFSGTGPLESAYQVGTSVPVPPNLALDKGVKLQNGKIVFGSDVTSVKKEDCPEPISRTKLKETLIKNKLA
jgi:hypothetical protein